MRGERLLEIAAINHMQKMLLENEFDGERESGKETQITNKMTY